MLALGRAGGDHVVDLGVALRVQRGERRGPRAAASSPACRGGAPAARRCRASPGRCAAACSRGSAAIVRMLCSRSASLMMQDPQVLGHRHEHLAHRRGLLRLLGVELEPVELGDAVDDARRRRRRTRGSRSSEGDAGVLDRVVQQRGGDRDVVEAEVGDDRGHGERVGDVGLAATCGAGRWWASAATS